MRIRKNRQTGGYCCIFEKNQKSFYADLSFCGIPEFAIFVYNVSDKKPDFSKCVQRSYPPEIKKKYLQEGIMKFLLKE